MFALDTNTLIYFFKGEGQVAARLLNTSPAEILIPSVVVYELQVGIAKSTSPEKRTRQLAELLDLVEVAAFDGPAADASAAIRAALEFSGTPIGPIDNLIAGTAKSRNATLVTRNVREFARIEGLAVENWYNSV